MKSLGIPIYHIKGFTHWLVKNPKPCQFNNFKRISEIKVDDTLSNNTLYGTGRKVNYFKIAIFLIPRHPI